jgi:hypothetical protein
MTLILALACSRPMPSPPVTRDSGVRAVIDADDVRAETPIRRLEGQGRAPITLVGAVHLADAAYYQVLHEVLSGCPVVLREGLAPEENAPQEAAEPIDLGPLLAAHGLVTQDEALPPEPDWQTVDRSVAEVRKDLLAAGASPELVYAWLDDRDQSDLARLLARPTGDERVRALARFGLLRGLLDAETEGDEADLYWQVLIGSRDAVVAERAASIAQENEEEGVCVLYGANHLADIETKLVHKGWARSSESWQAAIGVSFAELQLGAVQVKQLLSAASR